MTALISRPVIVGANEPCADWSDQGQAKCMTLSPRRRRIVIRRKGSLTNGKRGALINGSYRSYAQQAV